MRPVADKDPVGTRFSGTRTLPAGHGAQLVVFPDGSEIAMSRSSWLFMGCVRPRMHLAVVTTASRPSPLPLSCIAQPDTCGTTNGFTPVGWPAVLRLNW